MRRFGASALLSLIVVAVVGACALTGLSPGTALAQDKPGATPVDVFITPVFWFPFRSDLHTYGYRDSITRETPQGGLQLGVSLGNLSLALSGFWLSETHRLDGNTPGEEFTSTTHAERYDLAFTGSYTFRDVIKDRLSLSPGLGLFTSFVPQDETCNTGCENEQSRKGSNTFLWSLGPGLGATLRLADRWYLSANAAALWGQIHTEQTKTDGGDRTNAAFVHRGDVLVRFLLSDTVSLFAGYKIQLISAHGIHDILWHGPQFGLTVRYNVQ